MKMKESRRLSKSELKELDEFKNTNIVGSTMTSGIISLGVLVFFTNTIIPNMDVDLVYVIGIFSMMCLIAVFIFFMLYYLQKILAPFRIKYLKMIDIDNKEDDEDV